jgi:hypothetical protein
MFVEHAITGSNHSALNERLKKSNCVVRVTLSTAGYKQPTRVYFDLEYPRLSGDKAHVSAAPIDEDKLIANEETIKAIMADLNSKYELRSRR